MSTSSVAQSLSIAAIVLFVTVGLPWLMRHLFKTEPIAGEEYRNWIESLLGAADVRGTKPVRWDTNHRVVQCDGRRFPSGVSAACCCLIRLLDELPRDQSRDGRPTRSGTSSPQACPIANAFRVAGVGGRCAALTKMGGDKRLGDDLGKHRRNRMLTLLMLRIVAYRTEYDADVQACRLAVRIAGQVDGVPETP